MAIADPEPCVPRNWKHPTWSPWSLPFFQNPNKVAKNIHRTLSSGSNDITGLGRERAQRVGHKTTGIGTEAAASPPRAGDRCPGSHRTKQATAGQDSGFQKTQGGSFSINEDGNWGTSHSHFHCDPFLAIALL